MAHLSGDAITHLEDFSKDVKVFNTPVPKTHQCETCALTKSQQIISRSSDKSKNRNTPFARVSVDLIQFESGLNGHQWATHIACMYTDFNVLTTHRTKTGYCSFILDSIALFKRRFDWDVVFIRSDNETSFTNEFKDTLVKKSITLEESAPDTPA